MFKRTPRFLVLLLVCIFFICTLAPSALHAQEHTGVQGFVIRLYETCLGRAPDPQGLQNWVDHLQSGQISGGQAAYGFVFSTELVSQNLSDSQFLDIMYRAFFGRAPDAGGFANWMGHLGQGMSRENVFAHFVNSQEFAAICASYGIQAGTIAAQAAPTVQKDQKIQGSDQFYSLISEALALLKNHDPEAYAQYRLASRIIETPLQAAFAATDGKNVYIDLSNREFPEVPFAYEIACVLSHEFNHLANWDYYRRTGDLYGMEIMAFNQQFYTAQRLGMPDQYLYYILWVIDNIYYLYLQSPSFGADIR